MEGRAENLQQKRKKYLILMLSSLHRKKSRYLYIYISVVRSCQKRNRFTHVYSSLYGTNFPIVSRGNRKRLRTAFGIAERTLYSIFIVGMHHVNHSHAMKELPESEAIREMRMLNKGGGTETGRESAVGTGTGRRRWRWSWVMQPLHAFHLNK